MSGTLIAIPGLAGSIPSVSAITSGRVPAFWGAGQDMNARTFSPPTRWSKPGYLLRRPRVVFVGTTWPSGPLSVGATGLLTLATTSPLAGMTVNDIPGTKPQDFVFSQQETHTGVDRYAIAHFDYSGFQAIPSPMKFPELAGQPFVSSDFLYVLVASTFNAHDLVNIDQLIAQKLWFPRMSLRIFTPVPPEFLGDKTSLQSGEATVLANLVRINAAWNQALQSAVAELQAAGIDALIVGTEADVTIEVVGNLIADHFD